MPLDLAILLPSLLRAAVADLLGDTSEHAIPSRRRLIKAARAAAQAMTANATGVVSVDELARLLDVWFEDHEVAERFATELFDMGPGGVVSVQKSQSTGMSFDRVDMLRLPREEITPIIPASIAALGHEYSRVRPSVAILESGLSEREIEEAINPSLNAGESVVIVADEMDRNLSRALGHFQQRDPGIVALTVAHSGPNRATVLNDIAAITGATPLGHGEIHRALRSGLALGRAGQITVGEHDATILGTPPANVDRYRIRSGRVAEKALLVGIGGGSEAERDEKQTRFVRALGTARGSLEGVVDFGGQAFSSAQGALNRLAASEPSDALSAQAVSRVLQQLSDRLQASEQPQSLPAAMTARALVDAASTAVLGDHLSPGELPSYVPLSGSLRDVRVESGRQTLKARAITESEGPDSRREEPRYVNVFFSETNGTRLPRKTNFVAGGRYWLNLNVGAIEADSIVRNSLDADVKLPPSDTGHWLEVVVASSGFLADSKRHYLFVPSTGSSWKCGCRPGVRLHKCTPKTRKPYLEIPVTAPSEPTSARLRIGLYFRKNLLQSLLVTATITRQGGAGVGHWADVDYSITHGLTALDRLPPRSVNLLFNDELNGDHRLLINGRRGVPLSLTANDERMRTAASSARQDLWNCQFSLAEGGQPVFRYGLNDNSRDEAELLADLRQLASSGWILMSSLFSDTNLLKQAREAIIPDDAAMSQPVTIQVSRTSNSTLVYPWQMVYDIEPESYPAEWKRVCPELALWLRTRHEPAGSVCPQASSHTTDTLCLYGFWGFAHILESPPPHHTERALQTGPPPPGPTPDRILAYGTDLPDPQLTQNHIQALMNERKDHTIECTKTSQVRQQLSGLRHDVVYFYCHGRRDTSASRVIPIVALSKSDQIAPSLITGWGTRWASGHWIPRGPLVFLNSCMSLELLPDDLVDFADAFIGAGAAGLIGTEIAMDQRIASEVGAGLLGSLDTGLPVGSALRTMRWTLLGKGNAMGLAYTPYCSLSLSI